MMTKKIVIPQNILKRYFILHEEIKSIGRKYPLEAFNEVILTQEYERITRPQKQFYFYMTASVVALVVATSLFPFIAEQHSLITDLDNDIAKIRRNFGIGIASVASLAFVGSTFQASRALGLSTGNLKTKLTKDALHPAKADLIFDIVQKIIRYKIPVGCYEDNRVKPLRLHFYTSQPRPGAMISLLGDERHRQALWRDGPVPKGPILIERKYLDQIFGDFIKSQSGLNDGTGRRSLVTALLVKKHLENCIREMTAGGYWRNHRETAKKRKLMDISELLANNWPIWEKFRKNIKTSLKMGKDKDSEFYHFATKLRVICRSDEKEIIEILNGYDQVAIKFFRELEAIPAPDLLPKSTQVKRFIADS